MTSQPTLHTERLILRPFALTDAAEVQRLAGDRDIAATTLLIPHPYEDGMAEEWISTHKDEFQSGQQAVFAVVLAAEKRLVGAVGLDFNEQHCRAEMGYWIGKPYWGRGYCTEAARALLEYAFGQRGLNRVSAHHFANNPASGRVMRNIGMVHEGCLRQHVQKWNVFLDAELYAILKDEFPPVVSREKTLDR